MSLTGNIDKEDLSTYSFIKNNANIFTSTQDKYSHVISRSDTIYTILDYAKIFEDICDYLEGYIDYAESDDDKYDSKVIISTSRFYESMFNDKRYRTDFVLYEFPDIQKDFLEGTKDLQEMLVKMAESDNELRSMIVLTNNQYNRIAKVFKDDYCIWRMLIKLPTYDPTESDRDRFNDKTTPCIHKKKKEEDDY